MKGSKASTNRKANNKTNAKIALHHTRHCALTICTYVVLTEGAVSAEVLSQLGLSGVVAHRPAAVTQAPVHHVPVPGPRVEALYSVHAYVGVCVRCASLGAICNMIVCLQQQNVMIMCFEQMWAHLSRTPPQS